MRPLSMFRPVRLASLRPLNIPARQFHVSFRRSQEHSDPLAHRNFYKTHGRALFKALTLAFFSYQCFYWLWLTFETEVEKDMKTREIKSLEGEVRLLEEGRASHNPGAHLGDMKTGKRILEEGRNT